MNTTIASEITGKVWKIEAAAGTKLAEDDPTAILESMKMEILVSAPIDCTVVEISTPRATRWPRVRRSRRGRGLRPYHSRRAIAFQGIEASARGDDQPGAETDGDAIDGVEPLATCASQPPNETPEIEPKRSHAFMGLSEAQTGPSGDAGFEQFLQIRRGTCPGRRGGGRLRNRPIWDRSPRNRRL
ncbi:MAG: acetyl-CoA carboxylase biotin carboxyl carrier protein subunit [Alphaproteobacteria bacterium]